MKQNDAFPSKYLKADDCSTPLNATIHLILLENLGADEDKDEQKPVVYFKELKKGLALNKTNFASIVELTGEEDSDLWEGKQIQLYKATTMYKGQSTPCIRVRGVSAPVHTGISPLQKKQLFDLAEEKELSHEAVMAFMWEEMGVQSIAGLSEKQYKDLMECFQVGYIGEWWEKNKPTVFPLDSETKGNAA